VSSARIRSYEIGLSTPRGAEDEHADVPKERELTLPPIVWFVVSTGTLTGLLLSNEFLYIYGTTTTPAG
jgi:hypothetical protein